MKKGQEMVHARNVPQVLFPRSLGYQGLIWAQGFYFDISLLGEEEVKKRILALWTKGSQVYNLPHGFYLSLPQPMWVHQQKSLGTPVVELEKSPFRLVSSVPLSKKERVQLQITQDALVLLLFGQIYVFHEKDLVQVELSTWFKVDEYTWVEVASLGQLAVSVWAEGAKPITTELRQQIGVPALDPSAWQSLLQENLLQESVKSSTKEKTSSWMSSFLQAGASMAGRLASMLTPFTHSSKIQDPLHAERYSQTPNWLLRLQSSLRRLSARFLDQTRLSSILTKRQSAFVSKMMDLFESGNLEDALRYAIPLSQGMENPQEPSDPAFGIPNPREQLQISAQSQQGKALYGSLGFINELKKLYEQAFIKLEREQQIEKAAFVLAELLGKSEEAVSFLEKHQKYELAAQVAELRKLPPALLVRQWILAGNIPRAIVLAKRHQAFADAIIRLESTHPKQSTQLRYLWADSLLKAGDDFAAVQVLSSVPEAREQVRTLLEQIILLGGPVAARALVKKWEIFKETFVQVQTQMVSWLQQPENEEWEIHSVFHSALLQIPTKFESLQTKVHPEKEEQMSQLVKILLRDWLQKSSSVEMMSQSDWVKRIRDPLFRFEMQKSKKTHRQISSSTTTDSKKQQLTKIEITAQDRGTLPIWDQVLLPNGNMLVALGEAGVLLLDRQGQKRKHFDEPAHFLVLSEQGQQVLCLAKRGTRHRISKIDIRKQVANFWVEVVLSSWAKDYNGVLWFVGIEHQIVAIDVQSNHWEILWKVDGLPGKVKALVASSTSMSALLLCEKTVSSQGSHWFSRDKEPQPLGPQEISKQVWQYDLPSFTLRKRYELTNQRGIVIGLFPAGGVVLGKENISAQDSDLQVVIENLHSGPTTYRFPLQNGNIDADSKESSPSEILWQDVSTLMEEIFPFGQNVSTSMEDVFPLYGAELWIPISLSYQGDQQLYLFSPYDESCIAFILKDTKHIHVHGQGNQISFSDERGRLFVYDVKTRKLIRDIRISITT